MYFDFLQFYGYEQVFFQLQNILVFINDNEKLDRFCLILLYTLSKFAD